MDCSKRTLMLAGIVGVGALLALTVGAAADTGKAKVAPDTVGIPRP